MNTATLIVLILILNTLAIIRLEFKVRKLRKITDGLSALELFKNLFGHKADDDIMSSIMRKQKLTPDQLMSIVEKARKEQKGENKDAGQS